MAVNCTSQQNVFTLFVENDRRVRINQNSVDVRLRMSPLYFPRSSFVTIEREPGFFSIHDSQNIQQCFAISPEWASESQNCENDEMELNILYTADQVVAEEYEPGKQTQLFQWVLPSVGSSGKTLSKSKGKYHLVSKVKNNQQEQIAVVYRDRKLKISKYKPEDKSHEIRVNLILEEDVVDLIKRQLLWLCESGQILFTFFVVSKNTVPSSNDGRKEHEPKVFLE